MSYAEKLEELQRLRAEVRRLERQAEAEAKRMQPLTEQDERQMYADQATFDPSYVSAGRKAPPPLGHERPDQYKRRLAAGLKGYSSRWSKSDFDSMADDVFAIAQEQVRADAIANGRTVGLQPMEIQERVGRTPGGHTQVEFVGGEHASFINTFRRPARRALFKDQTEYRKMADSAQLSRITEFARYGQRSIVQAPRVAF